jgi:hypothetical protein
MSDLISIIETDPDLAIDAWDRSAHRLTREGLAGGNGRAATGERATKHGAVDPTADVLPSRAHQRAVQGLAHLLDQAVKPGLEATAAWLWKTPNGEFTPDVMVYAPNEDVTAFTGTPALIVEVVEGNRIVELVTRSSRYAAAGVDRFAILDLTDKTVTVFERAGLDYRVTGIVAGSGRCDFGVADIDIDLTRIAD